MQLRNAHILLVEDDPAEARLVRLALAEGSASVNDFVHVTSLSDALSRILTTSFDVILLDLSLPDSHGTATVERVCGSAPKTPIVVLTGNDDAAVAMQSLWLGAQDHLHKAEINPSALNRALRYAVERKQAELALVAAHQLNDAILASLTAHIAVLDHSGRVVVVNEAWNQFALENGAASLQGLSVGANYLDVCSKAYESGESSVSTVLNGIRTIMYGTSRMFTYEYPCHAPGQERWFMLTVTPLKSALGWVVVAHHDITERKLTEQALARRVSELDLAEEAIRDVHQALDASLPQQNHEPATERR